MTRSRRIQTLAAALAAAAALTLTGCSGLDFRDSICSDGYYPVQTVNGTGSDCLEDGEEPGEGYFRHPEGKVPEHVDDKWDVYWRTHSLDENGKIVKLDENGNPVKKS
ncbi:lipoprotein [Streptomyces sp. NBRC 14336]|uniref:SCO0607 family lipoprotein n=1 Tax=Streptomyces sp. NBRC 14336 TaxID=3030992 RepID=UPI0024A53BFB|nr:hypothetical protein [Streptomyces sp. NBRC 14336]WBO79645.1 hypothetical protein SBE_003360 [Streptomyces sp. SBE_14.2]GLW50977.1 lipoprotein [Streptomyces sp. NBRC 14336]